MTIGYWAWSHDSTVYTIFQYDANEKLTMIDQHEKNQAGTIIQLFYDNAGRLTKSVTRFPHFADEEIDSFYYNSRNSITRMRTVWGDDPANHYFEEMALTYDAAGRLIADTTHFEGSADYHFRSYQYDANDDLVRWSESRTYQGILTNFTPAEASYNTGRNPYKKLGLMYYLLTEDNVVLSAHERASENWMPGSPASVTYRYDYFPNGLVKRIIINKFQSPPP
jgi:hypothetical protein